MTDNNPLIVKQPIFEVTLPQSNEKITCRPWLVKEERILLSAKESGKIEDISLAIQQTMRNCILDKDFDIKTLSVIDMDYVFLRTRAEAVGNTVKVSYICNNIPAGTDKECGSEFDFVLDLSVMKPNKPLVEKFEEVPLTNELVVKFRYPLFEKIRNIVSSDSSADQTTKKILSVIDYIAPKSKKSEDVIDPSTMSLEAFNTFLESLTTAQFNVLENFIEDLPEINLRAEAVCPGCGFKHETEFNELSNFF